MGANMKTEYLYYYSGERVDIAGMLLRLKIIKRYWLENLEVVLAKFDPPQTQPTDKEVIFVQHAVEYSMEDLFNGKEKWIVARLFEAPFAPATQEELVKKLRHLDNGMLTLQKKEIEKIIAINRARLD